MKNLKLIQVFRTLKPAEFREFILFIRSPYFNESKTLIHLTEILKKFYPDFNSDELNRHHVFNMLHPNEAYNDKKLRDACSGLFKLVIRYISLTEYNNDNYLKDKLLLKTLDKRHLDKLFIKYIKHSEDEVSQINTDMPEHYLRGMEVKSIKTDFFIRRDNYKPIFNDIVERNEHTIFYFIFRWIFDLMEIDIIKNNLGYNITNFEFYKYFNIELFIDELKNKNHKYYSHIALHYYCYKLILYPNDENLLTEYLILFNNNIDKFQRNEQFYFYLRIENILEKKEGLKYSSIAFEIYKRMLNKNLYSFIEGEYFPLIMFKNIIEYGLYLNEFDWLRTFINKYLNKLHPNHRQAMLAYYKGQIEFEKGNFDRSLHYISKVQSDIIDLKWDMRYLVLLIYYELNETEHMLSILDSVRHYINRDKHESEEQKKERIEFLNYLQKLIKVKIEPSNEDILILKKELQNSKVMARKWMLEKLNELQGTLITTN